MPAGGATEVDPEVRRVVGEAVRVFETDLGCTVEAADPGWPNPYETFWALVALETDLRGLREMARGHRHGMSPHLVAFLDRSWTAKEFTDAVTTRKAVCNRIWRLMRSYDLLLTPTLAVPPSPLYTQEPEIIDGRMVAPTQWLCFTFPLNPMNMTGQPAATVPAGFTQDGLPVGLQIIGGASGRSIGPAGLCRLRGRPALSFSVCTMPRLRRLLRHDPTFFSVSRTSRALETLNLRSVMTLSAISLIVSASPVCRSVFSVVRRASPKKATCERGTVRGRISVKSMSGLKMRMTPSALFASIISSHKLYLSGLDLGGSFAFLRIRPAIRLSFSMDQTVLVGGQATAAELKVVVGVAVGREEALRAPC